MTKDQVETMWFRRIVAALMVASILYGATPVVMNTLFPVAKNR